MFEDHSELLNMFSKFKELKTKEEQASSLELAEHANLVMETLDEGIRSLDDMNVFYDYLKEVGNTHRRVPGFTADHFWVRFIWFFVIVRWQNKTFYPTIEILHTVSNYDNFFIFRTL